MSGKIETQILPQDHDDDDDDFGSSSAIVEAAPTKMFGPYELRGEINRGGMGIVYRAYHTELERVVALKVMRAGAPSDEERRRFEREAEATAQLDHPGIIKVIDAGNVDGVPYYAMELIKGRGLDALISGSVMTREEVCRKAITVAEALQHAHQNGLLHRDLKPSNVLVTESGETKLFDFGLAKSLEPETTRLTESGFVVGTPNYMSPEQARGEKQLTSASDLFSLGSVFYEMLTGEMAFPGHEGHEVLNSILEHDPIPPQRHDPTIEPDLQAICLKMVSKEIDDRYLSAAVFAQDLRNFLEKRRTIARRPGVWKRFSRLIRRHRTTVTWLMVFWILLSFSVLWHLFDRHQMLDEITALDQKRDDLDQAWSRERRKLAQKQAEALFYRGLWMAEQDRHAEALKSFRSALATDPDFSEARYQIARMLYELGVEANGRGEIQKAADLLAESTSHDPGRLEAVLLLSQLWLELGKLKPAHQLARRYAKRKPRSLEGMLLLSRVLLATGRVHEAYRLAVRASEVAPENAAPWALIGRILVATERPGQGLGILTKSIELKPSWEGYHFRALAQFQTGNSTEAIEDCNEALELRTGSLQTLLMRSRIYLQQDRIQDARADLDAVLAGTTGIPLRDAFHKTYALLHLGRYKEAIDAARTWAELEPRDPQPWRVMARLQERGDRRAEAIKAWRQVTHRQLGDAEALREIKRLESLPVERESGND